MRHYIGAAFECDAPDNCCLFCKNCTDVFYDSRGPYMFAGEDCDGDWRTCGKFEPEEEFGT